MSDDSFPDEEQNEVLDEDLQLVNMGISPAIADGWKLHNNKLTVIHRDGFPLNSFFDHLLASVNEKKMAILKENINKFRPAQQKKLESAEVIEVGHNLPEEFSITPIIELTKTPEQKIKDLEVFLQKYINLHEQGKEYVLKYKEQLKWLYDLMTSDKMEFVKGITTKEFDKIKEIEEVLER